MQTAETFARAREVAKSVVEVVKDARVVGLSGAIGGRDASPIIYYGHAMAYTQHGEKYLQFWPGDEIRDAERSRYVIDGVLMYVAAWRSGSDGYVVLHPAVTDADSIHLPRRTYVMRTTTNIPALRGAAF